MPVALTNLLFGAAVFVATYYTTRHGLRLFDGQLDSIVGFTLGADQQSAPEVAAILGRTNLVVFLILTGLITILFLQPPLRFFTTPHQPLHPDRWAAWMVLASIALLAVIMATGLRSWLQLAEIPGWGYAALTAAVVALDPHPARRPAPKDPTPQPASPSRPPRDKPMLVSNRQGVGKPR